jgi:hypothetical protein
MSDYTKSHRIGAYTATISWGRTTPPAVTWSPPITDEQRRRVESTEGYESMMMSFIGEAMAALHGTEVIYLDPDTGQELKRIPPDKKKWK